MRRAVSTAVKNILSSDPRKALGGIKTVRALGSLAQDEYQAVVPALLEKLKTDNKDLNNAALDTLLSIGATNPDVAVSLVRPVTAYLDALCKAGAGEPNRYIGRITKSVSILGQVTRYNPEALAISTSTLARVISPPIYRPDRGPTWIKLYSGVLKILAVVIRAQPASAGPAAKAIVRCVVDTFKYRTLRENAHQPDGMRWQAVLALKETLSSNAKVALLPMLRATSEENREAKQFMLNAIISVLKNTEDVIPYIINALDDRSAEVRRSVEYLLDVCAKTYPKEFERYLPSLLNHPKKEVKLNGIKILAIMGKARPEALKPYMKDIQEWCVDKNRDVRRLAVDTIGKIGGEEPTAVDPLLPFVVNALRDNDESVRLTAIASLTAIGTKRADMVEFAIPGIIERLRDPKEHVQWRARDLLMKLNVDHIEYPRAWRMLDKAKKKMAAIKREGGAIPTQLEHLVKEAGDALMAREYARAYDMAHEAIESLASIEGGVSDIGGGEVGVVGAGTVAGADASGGYVGEVEWVEFGEEGGEDETGLDRGGVGERGIVAKDGAIMGDVGGTKAEESYDSLGPDIRDVEEIPLTQKVSEMISLVQKHKSSEGAGGGGGDAKSDYISELLERFRREMAEINSDYGVEEEGEGELDVDMGEGVDMGIKTGNVSDDGSGGVMGADEGHEVKAEGDKARPRRFCHYCGNPIPPDSIFCNKCGRKLV